MTKYKVLRRPLDGEPGEVRWEPVGEYDAHDTKGAVKAAILAMNETGRAEAAKTIFAATPAGSWQEHAPTVSVETRVSF